MSAQPAHSNDDLVLSSIINAAGKIEQLEALRARLFDLGAEFTRLLLRGDEWSEDVADWGLWFEDNAAGGETVNLFSSPPWAKWFCNQLSDLIDGQNGSLDEFVDQAHVDFSKWVIEATGNPPKPTAVPALTDTESE